MKLKNVFMAIVLSLAYIAGFVTQAYAGEEQSTLKYSIVDQEEKMFGRKKFSSEDKLQFSKKLIDAAQNGYANEPMWIMLIKINPQPLY